MKMPQELFDKWLAALRSGDIPQGKQYLHQLDGSMCCLGVLCHVAGVPKGTYDDDYFLYDGSYAALPDRLAKKWGFYDWLGATLDDDDTLASMNDGGKTFAEIADFIESNRDRVLK